VSLSFTCSLSFFVDSDLSPWRFNGCSLFFPASFSLLVFGVFRSGFFFLNSLSSPPPAPSLNSHPFGRSFYSSLLSNLFFASLKNRHCLCPLFVVRPCVFHWLSGCPLFFYVTPFKPVIPPPFSFFSYLFLKLATLILSLFYVFLPPSSPPNEHSLTPFLPNLPFEC